MTVDYTTHFRFGKPRFDTSPWHEDFRAMIDHIDATVYSAVYLAGARYWTNSTLYAPGFVTIDPQDGTLWVCGVTHTSAASPTLFAADRVAHPTFWHEVASGGSGGVTDAEYIVAAPHAGLSAERVLTDSGTLTWDFSTPGQVIGNVIGGGYTDEQAQDAVGGILASTTSVIAAYDDVTPAISFQRAALTGDITAAQNSNATTLATVNANVGTFGSATQVGQFTVNAKGLITAAAAVAIAIASTAITDFTEATQDVVGAFIADSSTIDFTYNDAGNSLTAALIPGGITSLANLVTIQGRTVTLADAGFDVLFGWDDSANAYKNFALADILTEAAPAAGDFVLIYGAEGDVRKVNWSGLPGGGGGTPGGADTNVQFNDGGAFGGVSGFTFDKTAITTTWTSTDAGAGVGPILRLDRNSASPANNDALGAIYWRGRDSGGNATDYVVQYAVAPTVTDTSESGGLRWEMFSGGVNGVRLQLNGTNLSPGTNDGQALGTTSLGWSDIHLADTGVINWANGSARIIHSSAAGARRLEYNITTTEADITLGFTGTHTFSTTTTGYGVLNQLGATFNTGSTNSTWRQYYSQSLVNVQSSVAAGSHYAYQVQCGTFGAAPTGSLIEQVVFYCDQMTGQHSGSASLTITSNMGLRVANQSAASGGSGTITITNSYGVKVDDQGIGATNYAVYTGVGNNRFGDDFLIAATAIANVTTEVANSSRTPRFQVLGTDAATASGMFARYSADASNPTLHFAKSRNATEGSHTVVQSGDNLGRISWAGSDGTNMAEAAHIEVVVDGTPGAGDMPGKFVFATSLDGSESPTDRLTIDNIGQMLLAVNGATSGGVVPGIFITRLEADYTLGNNTNGQKLFNASTNGTLTLPLGSYIFECVLGITSMSATSGNASFDVLGAGTAVLGNILSAGVGGDITAAQAGAATGGGWTQTSALGPANGSAVTAAVNTAMWLLWKGSFKVTTAGTIIPSIDLVTASAAIVESGSYFACWRMGDATTATIGPWS